MKSSRIDEVKFNIFHDDKKNLSVLFVAVCERFGRDFVKIKMELFIDFFVGIARKNLFTEKK